MYIFGGSDENSNRNDIWCLDLSEFTWSQCSFDGYSPERDGIESRYVFHENKAYAIQKGLLSDIETIKEFDLENMTYKSHPIPKSQTETRFLFEPLPQVSDGKIYILENYPVRKKTDSDVIRQVLAFDLNTKSWTEIITESFPNLDKVGSTLYYNDHLLFYPIIEGNEGVYGEFWSLSLTPPKPPKYSSTSTNINKVQQTMKEFFGEAPYSDVTFEVESQTIPAHKWLLTQRNRFFANMFSAEMPEEKTSRIIINDLKAATFRALLEYLYSDHVEIDDTIALELLRQADKYFITGELKNTCEKHLIKNIELENYVAFGKLAEPVGATSLRDAVVVFIARNMKKIKPRKDFDEISDALLRDSIVKFIVK